MIQAGNRNLSFIRGCTFEGEEFQMLQADFTPVDLTGWTVAAEVRVTNGTTVIIDLAPTISSPSTGVITIPGIDDETTLTYTAGSYKWDLLLEDGSDNRQQILSGSFTISEKITDS